jgi:hypothetical protein
MVQTADMYGHFADVPFEDLESLKKYLRANYANVKTLEFSHAQTTTAAAVELMEQSGETVAFTAANATIQVWQKTNQAADVGKVISFQYVTSAGGMTAGSATLAADTTTKTACVPAVTNFFRLVPGTLRTTGLVADEVMIGIAAGTVHGVIKVGCWQDAISRFYAPASTVRCFLARVEAKGAHTNPSTYTITLTRKGDTLQTVHSKDDLISTRWDSFDPCWELEPLTDMTITILKNADADHALLTLRYKIVIAF